MVDERELFEKLIYYSTQGRRFTQQSPVMPDVWIHFGMQPGEQQELLMEPNWHFTPADLASGLRARLAGKGATRLKDIRTGPGKAPAIACNQNVVAVRLWFDQLVRAALPMSSWWKTALARLGPDNRETTDDDFCQRLEDADFERQLAEGLAGRPQEGISADVLWFARVAGLIALVSTPGGRRRMQADKKARRGARFLHEAQENHQAIAEAFVALMKGVAGMTRADPTPLFSVNRNRDTSSSVYLSVNAIKADAAKALFTTKGAEVSWAVVDSGIDATHEAFRKFQRTGREETAFAEAFPAIATTRRRRKGRPAPPSTGPAPCDNNTRIVATYDFVNVRDLLGAEEQDVEGLVDKFPILAFESWRQELREILKARHKYVVDWSRLEPFLRVDHNQSYRPPSNKHGTHVAGIIGADWRVPPAPGGAIEGPPTGEDMCGVAPAISLYDFRVLDANGAGTEFSIMSALQFIRDLNNRRDFVAIHGVNLSFSIQHDVANYACGRTPVCEEAERLVGSGVVVVAAAGNSGRARYVTPSGTDDEGFRTVSITDPGNAASAITVGSTHRSDAHTYGVSYFSSRGPTGDGRLKPDLVAPGEKIRSTVPGNQDALLDGTSMAAPHVSGAAALLMSRHREFVGQPQRIKQILCASATDLGRERYFQGAGLLDILRALQSI